MIALVGYAVGVLTSVICAALLIRSYLSHKTPLLLWCSFCFAGLAVNSMLLFADLFVVSDMSLELWRSGTALVSLALMIFGLVWEGDR